MTRADTHIVPPTKIPTFATDSTGYSIPCLKNRPTHSGTGYMKYTAICPAVDLAPQLFRKKQNHKWAKKERFASVQKGKNFQILEIKDFRTLANAAFP